MCTSLTAMHDWHQLDMLLTQECPKVSEEYSSIFVSVSYWDHLLNEVEVVCFSVPPMHFQKDSDQESTIPYDLSFHLAEGLECRMSNEDRRCHW